MNGNNSDRRDEIIDEAASWFVQMQRQDLDPSDLRVFADWLAGSSEHVREYLQMSLITSDIGNLAKAATKDALIQTGRDYQEENVVPLLRKGRKSDPGRVSRRNPMEWRRSLVAFWSTAIAVVSIALLGPWIFPSEQVFETAIGEQLSFPLDDGTIMTLNTQSKVVLSFTDNFRDVHLKHGEAMFDVKRDPERPFRVATGRAIIRAVGTAFNVHHRGDATVVTVVEGSIEVLSDPVRASTAQRKSAAVEDREDRKSPVLVTVGQQAHVEGNSGQVAVIETNVTQATAWRERRLVFESKPLSSVVGEFNLYNGSRILIGDSTLRNLEISGSFSANDRQSFVLFLQEAGLADGVMGADGTIILSAPEAKPH